MDHRDRSCSMAHVRASKDGWVEWTGVGDRVAHPPVRACFCTLDHPLVWSLSSSYRSDLTWVVRYQRWCVPIMA